MAYVITHKDNSFLKIYSDNDAVAHNNAINGYSNTSIFNKYQITEQEYLDVKNGVKILSTIEGNGPTFTDPEPNKIYFNTAEDLQNTVDNLKNNWQHFVNNHPSDSVYMARGKNYLNFLQNFNVNSLTFPMTQSFESYLNSINQPFLLISELP
jgi:hypothetical protein